MATEKDIQTSVNELTAILEGTRVPDAREAVHPERVSLFGGISGLTLAVPEFQLAPGLVVRDTYAHVMAPYLMAFAKPKAPNAPHPAPWKAARGGLGFDITIEVGLSLNARPTNFDRVNTLWWVLALLRLISGAPIRMPVISDIAFATIPTSADEPNLWTIEMPPQQLTVMKNPPREISLPHLEWVKDTLIDGSKLLDEPSFNRAFQTFDSAIWAHSLGSAIVMAWASMEALFRPGRRNITKTLAASIAAFLNPTGPERDRAFQGIEVLYGSRGSAAHNAEIPEVEQLLGTFDLARRSLAKCLERREIPDCEALLQKWKQRT